MNRGQAQKESESFEQVSHLKQPLPLQRQQIQASSHATKVSWPLFDGRKVSHHFQAITSIQLGITQKQDRGYSVYQSVFLFENSPKLFHYLLHIKLDPKRKPGFRRVNAVSTFSSSCTTDPLPHPLPAYCFWIQEGCAPSFSFPLTLSPYLLWSSPPFPTYNSISSCHNLSISLARPLGLRGLKMETGFVSKLTSLLLCFLADNSCTGWSEHF